MRWAAPRLSRGWPGRGVALLLALILWPGRGAAEEGATLQGEVARRPVLVALRAAEGLVLRADREALVRGLTRALRTHTDLEPLMVEELEESPSVVQACRSGLGCLVDLVRREDSVQFVVSLDVDPVAYADDDEAVGARAVLVDVRSARRVKAGAERDRDILRLSTSYPLGGLRVEGSLEVQEALGRRVVEEGLRPALERGGRWEPFASLEVRADVDGLTIEVDGRELGRTTAPLTRVVGLAAGTRQVVLRDPSGDHEIFTAELELSAGASSALVPALVRKRSLFNFDARSTAFWSGLALAAAGVGLSSYAMVTSAPSSVLCVSGPSGECSESARYRRFGEETLLAGLGPASAAEGSGPAILPLGVGLLVAGALSVGGSVLLDDDLSLWLTPVVGLAAGAGSYGLMLALEPGAL